MMPSQQGYDRAITVFSPDGRLYQVEYAIETVRRGSLALGIKTKNGIILAAEEKSKKLQISKSAQKIFQIDTHVGIVAAGYIPDARSQADNARFFSQSNRLVYDEPVDVETVAKHLADQAQQYTQYAGVRPFGVALIIAGIDRKGVNVYVIDPSGTYNSYSAIAIGTGSDEVNEFLEKNYKEGLTIDEAASLAIAAINLKSEEKSGVEHIKMSKILAEGKMIEKISPEDLKKFDEAAKGKFVK